MNTVQSIAGTPVPRHWDNNRALPILAHELRGPLAPIRYATASLIAKHPVGTPERRAAAIIERQIKSIEAIIDQVLDAARLEHSLVPTTRERISLGDAVADAVEAVAPYVTMCGHALHAELPPRPIYIDADVGQVGQIVRNLVTNAAKYTDRGGRIRVDLRSDADSAQICVRDTGIGLAPDQLESIFNLYAQAEQCGGARAAGGLGIGLFVARQLVTAHGGTILASSPGRNRGSEFVVSLPLAAS